MLRTVFFYKIESDLSFLEPAQKVSGLLRNARLVTWYQETQISKNIYLSLKKQLNIKKTTYNILIFLLMHVFSGF